MLYTLSNVNWDQAYLSEQSTQACKALEAGSILSFPHLPFTPSATEQQFLSPDFISPKTKNISYHRKMNTLSGIRQEQTIDTAALKAMMHRFSDCAHTLLTQLIPNYANALEIGRTSFRPVEIAGRTAPSVRKNDTLLHIDAFPSSPNQGKRILRVFSNINPHGQPRIWRTGEPFENVAKRFLPTVRRPWPFRGALLRALRVTRGYATEYDYTMLQIHNNMKSDTLYQTTVAYEEIAFAPQTTWIVQTDHVSHAALLGQHVLEQTFYLPVEAMQSPALSPLQILERLTQRVLV